MLFGPAQRVTGSNRQNALSLDAWSIGLLFSLPGLGVLHSGPVSSRNHPVGWRKRGSTDLQLRTHIPLRGCSPS